MGTEMKIARSVSQIEPQKFAFGLVLGCLLCSLTYVSVFKFDVVSLLNSASPSSLTAPPFENNVTSQQLGRGLKNVTLESDKNEAFVMIWNSSSSSSSLAADPSNSTQQQDLKGAGQEISLQCELCGKENGTTTITTTANSSGSDKIDSIQKTAAFEAMKTDERRNDLNPAKKPMCDFSNRRIDRCEIEGDVRILGRNSSIFLVNSRETDGPYRNETWWIKPYPRKTDTNAMSNVKELTLKSLEPFEEAPQCTDHHDVPAVVFSVRGYTGNFFHAFTDVFVPLFETSHEFNGEVRFLITEFRAWWINRFLPIFKSLSRYDMIDLDNDDRVLCFPRAIVGLKSHGDFSIDPSPSPEGYSMVDFSRFMRSAYSLKRDSVAVGTRRPRLLIISRERTRKFANLKDVIHLAEKMGYEVVVSEANIDLAQFSQVVNSCDVMMGVHGAGLTNIVFLPTNAVLIQIVPWGGLNWIARTYFDKPSKEMKLNYLEYSISKEESTLIEKYPRDHAVFTDPASIRKEGWIPMKEVFLDKQDVKLNLRRFKPVLKKALALLHTRSRE
ncbi:uncharacterized protein LOC109716026 [Ananas comosus]|uniref:Uncharacterized protein LOC109716026 n=1 Tax=Ananas comosus TaxID=4615 RepID=A0A6P5FTP7_ANACO|nr:uncharacterized protein LOC109716026 [Ananas comosus]